MSIVSVKCPYKHRILLPDGVTLAVGDACFCPKSCPSFGARKYGCMYGSFNLTNKSFGTENADGGFEYTPEEAEKHYGTVSAAPVRPAVVEPPRAEPVRPAVVEPPRVEPVRPAAVEPPRAEPAPSGGKYDMPIFTEAAPSGGSGGKYDMPIFSREAVPAPAPVTPARDEDDAFSYVGHHNAYELRGVYYTFGGNANTENLRTAAVAERLFVRILRSFDIDAVFSGDRLRDDFKWVLNGVLDDERKRRVREVLNDTESDRAQKFVALFYYGILFGVKLPLYWAKRYTPNLQPVYRDEREFYNGIVGRDGSRFYGDNTRTVLIWLKRTLPSADDVNRCVVEIQDRVALDPSLDTVIFWSNGAFRGLGNKREFVGRLAVSDKPLDELAGTAEFLSKYDIVSERGSYRVVKRPVPDTEYAIVPKSSPDDNLLARLFGREKSVDKLHHYLYILKRYSEMFEPPDVKVGGTNYVAERFTDMLEDAVSDMCAYAIGEGTDAARNDRYVSALLGKILYENEIVFAEALRGRDATYMTAVLSLVDKVNSAEFVDAYFRAFENKPEKLRIFATDTLKMPHVSRMMTVREYMLMLIAGVGSSAGLLGEISSPIFSAYARAFGTPGGSVDHVLDACRRNETELVEKIKNL